MRKNTKIKPVKVKGDTWRESQAKLQAATTEDEVMSLINEEQAGANRTRWLVRMRGRYKVLRNRREEAEHNHDVE